MTYQFEQHDKLVDAVSELLAGIHPAVQGSVLADLLGTYLAGFREEGRPMVMHNIFRTAFKFAQLRDDEDEDGE